MFSIAIVASQLIGTIIAVTCLVVYRSSYLQRCLAVYLIARAKSLEAQSRTMKDEYSKQKEALEVA